MSTVHIAVTHSMPTHHNTGMEHSHYNSSSLVAVNCGALEINTSVIDKIPVFNFLAPPLSLPLSIHH